MRNDTKLVSWIKITSLPHGIKNLRNVKIDVFRVEIKQESKK